MNSKTKVLVVGCSFTQGTGLNLEHCDPELWVNRLFYNTSITNVASAGANNHWIFLETISQLLTQSYDIVLVAWSAIPRYNFRVGLELYSVETMLTDRDINLNSKVTISGKWLESIGANLNRLHNDHWDILDLIKYVNTLVELQVTARNQKLIFVNAMGPWNNGYFTQKKIKLPSDLDQFEQTLLESNNRNDKDVLALYDMIHSQYSKYGGIHEHRWLNLYSSLQAQQIDVVSLTDPHPGYASQLAYVKYLTPILQKKLNENS
jgi:hypothetical protein